MHGAGVEYGAFQAYIHCIPSVSTPPSPASSVHYIALLHNTSGRMQRWKGGWAGRAGAHAYAHAHIYTYIIIQRNLSSGNTHPRAHRAIAPWMTDMLGLDGTGAVGGAWHTPWTLTSALAFHFVHHRRTPPSLRARTHTLLTVCLLCLSHPTMNAREMPSSSAPPGHHIITVTNISP